MTASGQGRTSRSGLNDSIGVILSNLCMDQERRVYFNEIDKMGVETAAAGKKA